jgi:hypothetical protein
MLASFFPTSMAEAYASKPPLARNLSTKWMQHLHTVHSSGSNGHWVSAPMDIGFRPSQFSPYRCRRGRAAYITTLDRHRRVHKDQ